MKSMTADIKTNPTEQVCLGSMPRTSVLELQPLYFILDASATKIAHVHPISKEINICGLWACPGGHSV